MKLKSAAVCPACKKPNEVFFDKPGALRPTVFKFTCKGCQTVCLVRATLPRQSERPRENQLHWTIAVMKLGPKLALKAVAEAASALAEERKAENESNF